MSDYVKSNLAVTEKRAALQSHLIFLSASVCDVNLCLPLWTGGPGRSRTFLPERSLHIHVSSLPTYSGGAQAQQSSSGETPEETGPAGSSFSLYCK